MRIYYTILPSTINLLLEAALWETISYFYIPYETPSETQTIMFHEFMSTLDKTRTKGQIEAEITSAITQFFRDLLGRGPKGARTYLVQDMVLVRITGVLNAAEELLVASDGGIDLLKSMRKRLIECSSDRIRTIIEDATGAIMVSLHTDMSTQTGERVVIIILDRNIEEHLRS